MTEKLSTITTTDALAALMAQYQGTPFVTVDTEFVRESTYWPELCLIQISDGKTHGLIDPLADGISLDPFFALMADESCVKVFHAARQDLEIIYALGNLIPAPLFDSQIAAMVCGFGDSIAYDKLVKEVNGAFIDKTSRFTDWSRRPLSEQQLSYALADVTHLVDVYLHLKERLEDEGRTEWLSSEMAILNAPETYDMPAEDAWRKVKMRLRKPRDLAVLQSIAAWRETEARRVNKPRGRILKDDGLLEIAMQHPKDSADLGKLRAVPRGWGNSAQAQGLLKAAHEAYGLDKSQLPEMPKHKPLPEGAAAAVDLLRVLLKQISEAEGVAAKILASTQDLERMAAEGPKANVPALSGWRMDVFGKAALDLLEGRVALKYENGKVSVVTL